MNATTETAKKAVAVSRFGGWGGWSEERGGGFQVSDAAITVCLWNSYNAQHSELQFIMTVTTALNTEVINCSEDC